MKGGLATFVTSGLPRTIGASVEAIGRRPGCSMSGSIGRIAARPGARCAEVVTSRMRGWCPRTRTGWPGWCRGWCPMSGRGSGQAPAPRPLRTPLCRSSRRPLSVGGVPGGGHCAEQTREQGASRAGLLGGGGSPHARQPDRSWPHATGTNRPPLAGAPAGPGAPVRGRGQAVTGA
jgi:hypothetical protein